MKDSKKRLKTVWAIAGTALLLIIIISVATSGSNNQDQAPAAESNNASTADGADGTPDYKNLTGFKLSTNASEGLYTYTTSEGGASYSVSLGVGQSLLEQHQANYPLERTTKALNDVEVSYGYNEALEAGGQLVQPEFNSLAFDFETDGTRYTGEITNLDNRSAKATLLNVLKQFVTALRM